MWVGAVLVGGVLKEVNLRREEAEELSLHPAQAGGSESDHM